MMARVSLRSVPGLLVFLLALAGCGGAPKPETPAPSVTLGDRIEKLTPREQLRALRALPASEQGAEALFFTGNAYYALGAALPEADHTTAVAYFDSAVTSYQGAVDADSTMSKAWVNMGLAYDSLNKKLDARKAFETALAVNPEDVLAMCHLGYMESLAGNPAAAVKLYQRALAHEPNNAQAHYFLGLAFAEAKVFKEALIEWETVARLDPDGDLGKAAADNVRIIKQYIDAAK